MRAVRPRLEAKGAAAGIDDVVSMSDANVCEHLVDRVCGRAAKRLWTLPGEAHGRWTEARYTPLVSRWHQRGWRTEPRQGQKLVGVAHARAQALGPARISVAVRLGDVPRATSVRAERRSRAGQGGKGAEGGRPPHVAGQERSRRRLPDKILRMRMLRVP